MGGRGSQSPHVTQRAAKIAEGALNWAKSQIGSNKYGPGAWTGTSFYGTAKCNLFIAHAFNKGNPQEQSMALTPSRLLLSTGIGRMRNFSASEIYNGRLPNFKLVKIPKPGDTAADGKHVGIVSGKGTTISASVITGKVVENDWGFRTKTKKTAKGMRFFRYTGED